MGVKVSQMLRPFNKGFSALQVKLIMNDLVYRYIKNVKDKIKVKYCKENNDYFIYAKIPSESNDTYPDSAPIHYDVIVQLSPPNKAAIALDSIREYDAKIFSNIPSFVFTFNYVYHQKRALVNLPSEYYTRRAIMEKPRVRNPLYLLGIDKSLWFTIFYLDEHRLFKRTNIDALIDGNLNLLKLLKDERVKTQDRKIDECELREKHKRDLKEVERKTKQRNSARSKISQKRLRDKEVEGLFNDLSSGLHSEKFKAESLKSNLTSNLNTRIGLKENNKEQNTLRSNLKSSLRRKR
jgi:hypothetical protein